jgi:hypothetical protein
MQLGMARLVMEADMLGQDISAIEQRSPVNGVALPGINSPRLAKRKGRKTKMPLIPCAYLDENGKPCKKRLHGKPAAGSHMGMHARLGHKRAK